MTDYSNTQYRELPIEETNPHFINQRNHYGEISLPESEAELPYQHSSRSSNGHSIHTNVHHLSLDQAISHARDAQAAPIIPINSAGSGAHDNCSATCILSHPRRSATIYVCILVAITCIVTGSLIALKAFRGDVPGAHVNPSVADQTPNQQTEILTSESIIIVDLANNVSIIDEIINQTTSTGIPVVPETVYDRIDRAIHNAVPTLQSANPKVPIDEDDMTSSMLLLLWGLSPLVSAVATISWTYLRYRKSITVPSEQSANRSDLILEPSSLVRDTSELRLHHHHPMFVNPSPHGEEDEDDENQSQRADEIYEPENNQIDQPLPANDNLIAINQRSSSQNDLISPPPSRPVRASTVGHAVIAQPLLSPNSRAVSEPMNLIPEPGPMARTVSAQGCPRPHRVAPFYSRPKKNRGWFWWVPRSRAQLSTLLRPFGRFLLRCYFLPIMVPTIGAVLQYAFACCAGYTGFLSPTFVPTLTSALSLPSTKTAELWSVTLAFFYELFFGVWWDPFPPGSADWGRGMDFSGASWMAISAMEEIGWAGLLFPCLYEIWPKNPTRASIVTGLIWSAWHWPMLVFGQMNLFPEAAAYHPGLLSTPFLYGFITFTLSTTFSRVIMVRLLLFSDDLWSQCVYHAAHNVMVFNFFAQLPDVDSSRYPHAGLFIAEAGIPLVLMYMSLACVIIYRWRTAERRKTRALAASHGIMLADGEAISPAHNQIIAQIINQSDTPEDLQFYPRSKSPDEVQMQARLALLSPVTEESARYQSFSSRRPSHAYSEADASTVAN